MLVKNEKKYVNKILKNVILGLNKWSNTREAEITHIREEKDFF